MSFYSPKTSPKDRERIRTPPQDLVARFDAACQANDRDAIMAARLQVEKMFGRIIYNTITKKTRENKIHEIFRAAIERLTDALDFPDSTDGKHLRRGTYRTVKSRTYDVIRNLDARPNLEPFDLTRHQTAGLLGGERDNSFLTESHARIDANRFIKTLSHEELAELQRAIVGESAVTDKQKRLRRRIKRQAEEFHNVNINYFQASFSDFEEDAPVSQDYLTNLTRFDIAMMAFELGCPDGRIEDAAKWVMTYPEFAYDFAACAAVQRGDLSFFFLEPAQEAEVDQMVMESMARFVARTKNAGLPLNA